MKSIIAALPPLVCASLAAEINGYFRKEDIPSTGKDWVTLDSGVEFQAGEGVDPRLEHVRKLWGSNKAEGTPLFADGTETNYDEYAQARRLMGFYIDCNHCGGEDSYNQAYCVQNGGQQACQRSFLALGCGRFPCHLNWAT
jgi:hypothetical protein